MKKRSGNYYKAIAIMIGYIVGVGMFGVPFLISKAGVGVFFVFMIFLGPIQYLLHLIYANIIIVTDSYHRLPGYAEKYLGKKSKGFVFFAKIFGNFGALLAYIIITGIFLNELLSPYFGGNEFIYTSLIFFLEAFVVFFGIGMIAYAELLMTILLFVVVGLITWRGWAFIDVGNYTAVDWKYVLIPYGAMLMSLDGGGSLPIVVKMLDKKKDEIKSVIFISTFLPVLLIITFTLVIVGISGGNTTPDALSGVKSVLNDGVIFFSLIFGILAMVSSFLGVAESVKETLAWDFKVNKNLSWALAVFVPYLLYLFGIKNFIEVISFVGAVGGGICAIVLVFIFVKLKKQDDKLVLFKRRPGIVITSLLVGLFVCGIIYEVYGFFAGLL